LLVSINYYFWEKILLQKLKQLLPMEIIRCIVLEDEEPAQNLLRHYFKRMPELELVEVFDNAIEASDFLEDNDVDLIITDIEMPRLSGLDFIRMLSPKPQIIIITAYRQHGSDAYELDATDYLVKPVHFERFQKAIEKVKRNLLLDAHKNTPSETAIYVKEDGKMVKLETDDIIYIEGLGDYVKITTKERSITTLSTMSKMIETLPSTKFMRVHRSHIINTDKIRSIDSPNSLVTMNDKREITLGRVYKQDFLARFKSIN
jgi:DNA-binding LytR/AlgR family response regulator